MSVGKGSVGSYSRNFLLSTHECLHSIPRLWFLLTQSASSAIRRQIPVWSLHFSSVLSDAESRGHSRSRAVSPSDVRYPARGRSQRPLEALLSAEGVDGGAAAGDRLGPASIRLRGRRRRRGKRVAITVGWEEALAEERSASQAIAVRL